jgi:8-oxo-dGTP diphosphatase
MTLTIRVATDAVIMTVKDGELAVLLIQMKKKPFTGQWALPGGLLEEGETSEGAARRILAAQTGVAKVYLEQLATFDALKRDPLGRALSVAYYALLPTPEVELRTTEKYSDVRWWPVSKLPKLAYDHDAILRAAISRLKARMGYTNIVWSLLPEIFTLNRLQATYETILGKKLDKRNFRKKLLSLNLLRSTGKKTKGGAFRPAELYRFRSKQLSFIDVL